MVVVIAVCEVGFWVLLAAGLLARYGLRLPRLGAALLVGAPLTDVVLLAVTGYDLARGGQATFAHGLAAAYLGFSVAFGHQVIAGLDRWAARRVTGEPAPPRLVGRQYTVDCWKSVARNVLALAVTAGVVALLTAIAESGRATELPGAVRVVATVLVIDAIWAVSYTVWPRRASGATDRGVENVA